MHTPDRRPFTLRDGALREPVAAEVDVPPGSPGEQAERALAVARTAGDRRAEVLALTDLGVALARDGAPARAVTVLEEALGSARQLGDRARECDVVGNLGWAVLLLG